MLNCICKKLIPIKLCQDHQGLFPGTYAVQKNDGAYTNLFGGCITCGDIAFDATTTHYMTGTCSHFNQQYRSKTGRKYNPPKQTKISIHTNRSENDILTIAKLLREK